MRNVLILFTDLLRTGGIQTYNRQLYNTLKSEFSQTRFIAVSLYGRRKNRSLQKISFVIKAILATFLYKPQFLICAHVDLSPIALFLKKTCSLRYAVLTHGIDVWGLRQGVKYAGLNNADIIITVSRYTKDRMVGNGIDKDKIKLLQDTVDTSLFYPKSADKNLLAGLKIENKKILLTVGRISSSERYKGHDTMLRVLKALGEEYVWLVIGSGDDLSRLRQKSKELGIAEKIRFLEEISNDRLVDYYNLCDVFVMPSKGEGFGITFLEAMACGKPVIGGNSDGSTEPLMNGKLGFLIDPDSAEEIIQAINLVFTVKENRTNANYLIKEIASNFGIQVFNKKAKEIFRNKL